MTENRIDAMQRAILEMPKIQLGTMNGWSENPREYDRHMTNPACVGKVSRHNISNCYNRYTCTHCGIVFDVDSSG